MMRVHTPVLRVLKPDTFEDLNYEGAIMMYEVRCRGYVVATVDGALNG